MLSEITLTLMRLGLLVLLWVFVFAVVGVLRGDLYGTRVKRRTAGLGKAARSAPAGVAPRPVTRSSRPDRGPAGGARGRPGSSSPPDRSPARRSPCAPPEPSSAAAPSASWCSTTTTSPAGTPASSRPTTAPWTVEDLRSTNGTFLGATRLTEPREVAVGSVLRIGQTVVELQR